MASYSTFDAFKHVKPQEGMYVLSDEDLRLLQRVLVKMLGEILDVCERCGVDLMLAYGSCLGAVRHHGFIPWDDDLDVAMFREDYERFKRVFEAELSDRYVLQDPESTPGYDLGFPRIRMRGTTLKCRDDFFVDKDCGVYIDILVWDSVPDNVILRNVQGFLSLAIGFCYSCRRFAKYGDYYTRMAGDDAVIARVFRRKRAIGKILSFASATAWTKAWYRWNGLVRDCNTKYVSIPGARKHFFGEMRRRCDLTPTKKVSFGGIEAPIPGNWHTYLTLLYGDDYMTPPPVEDQEKHVVLAFDLGGALEND